MFKRATKKQAKLRMLLQGPSGSGKTFTALRIARGLGGSVAVIDAESGTASKYADEPSPAGGAFEFQTHVLEHFHPNDYKSAIDAAAEAGFDVLIIDGISPEWKAILELVDKESVKFQAWAKMTPLHDSFVQKMLNYPGHLIATVRTKQDYVLEEYEEKGRKKTRPVKVGMAPVQREQIEYEYDVIATLDHELRCTITKTRCATLKGFVEFEVGEDLGRLLLKWLDSGESVEAQAPKSEPPKVNGAAEKRAVWEAIKALRAELGEETYADVVGSADWVPKDLADAKGGLEALKAAAMRVQEDAPAWMSEEADA